MGCYWTHFAHRMLRAKWVIRLGEVRSGMRWAAINAMRGAGFVGSVSRFGMVILICLSQYVVSGSEMK